MSKIVEILRIKKVVIMIKELKLVKLTLETDQTTILLVPEQFISMNSILSLVVITSSLTNIWPFVHLVRRLKEVGLVTIKDNRWKRSTSLGRLLL